MRRPQHWLLLGAASPADCARLAATLSGRDAELICWQDGACPWPDTLSERRVLDPDTLNAALATATQALRVDVLGGPGFIARWVPLLRGAGLQASALQLHFSSMAGEPDALRCLNCRHTTLTERQTVVRCAHCGHWLHWRDHYSKVHCAWQGVPLAADHPLLRRPASS